MAKKIRLPMPSGWKMEEVTPRMKTVCSCCGKPCIGHRFKHTIEGYPFPSVKTYRASCAVRAMRESLQSIQERIDGVAAYLASKGTP